MGILIKILLMKKIALLIPTLTNGGAERVMSVLANKLSGDENIEVHLILYLRDERFYLISDKVVIHSPDFDYTKFSRIKSTIKTFRFIRQTLKEVKPYSLLSFGGKYNSMVLLSSIGLGIKTYVSDRSRPGISYGKLQDFINPIVYRFSKGIIAQTSKAKEVAFKNTKHKNIVVIPNPVPNRYGQVAEKEKIILNVGRFIATKQQFNLIELFVGLQNKDWKLVFLGDGEHFEKCKELVSNLNMESQIELLGVQKDVNNYLSKSMIFAFTSISEGFPNSLAEAMAAGCACISFDCVAGPSDIIDHNQNGFLVPMNDWDTYTKLLADLMQNDNLRTKFGIEARNKANIFNEDAIVKEFKKVLFN